MRDPLAFQCTAWLSLGMSMERQHTNPACVAQGLAFFTNALDSSAHGRLFTTLSLENTHWPCACNIMTAHSRLQKSQKLCQTREQAQSKTWGLPPTHSPSHTHTHPKEIPKSIKQGKEEYHNCFTLTMLNMTWSTGGALSPWLFLPKWLTDSNCLMFPHRE